MSAAAYVKPVVDRPRGDVTVDVVALSQVLHPFYQEDRVTRRFIEADYRSESHGSEDSDAPTGPSELSANHLGVGQYDG